VKETRVERDASDAAPGVWALGDYHAFAKQTVWELGRVLIEACGVSAGQRVLDVAAGTGNAAIRAAEAGADVVASDLTPENFAAGMREAEARGVRLDWVEADAERLPFADGEFDVVTSLFGRCSLRTIEPSRGSCCGRGGRVPLRIPADPRQPTPRIVIAPVTHSSEGRSAGPLLWASRVR
jgi:SAM-dependent methyltransferase